MPLVKPMMMLFLNAVLVCCNHGFYEAVSTPNIHESSREKIILRKKKKSIKDLCMKLFGGIDFTAEEMETHNKLIDIPLSAIRYNNSSVDQESCCFSQLLLPDAANGKCKPPKILVFACF